MSGPKWKALRGLVLAGVLVWAGLFLIVWAVLEVKG